MHLLFSASFHWREFTGFSQSFAGSFFTLRTALGVVHAPREGLGAMRGSKQGQLVGAAGCGGFFQLSLTPRSNAGKVLQLSVGQRSRSVAVMPNPSIERTSPGKPGAASHLKR
jgi:hypothetical protein